MTVSHRAAACNTLCAFLEQAAASPVSKVRVNFHHKSIMIRVFNIYLQSSGGDSQSKPMKQLLKVLVKLLLRESSHDLSAAVVYATIDTCLSHIYAQKDSSCAKAAMTVITMLLQKRLISVELLLAKEDVVSSKNGEANPATQSRPISSPSKTRQDMPSSMSGFISQVMRWLRHRDTGPAAARLVIAIFRCLDDVSEDHCASPSPGVPIWSQLLLGAVHQQPELIENLEQYLLPDLLRINPLKTEEFLRTLPINELSRGNISHLATEDIRLCLAAMGVVEELGASSFFSKAAPG